MIKKLIANFADRSDTLKRLSNLEKNVRMFTSKELDEDDFGDAHEQRRVARE